MLVDLNPLFTADRSPLRVVVVVLFLTLIAKLYYTNKAALCLVFSKSASRYEFTLNKSNICFKNLLDGIKLLFYKRYLALSAQKIASKVVQSSISASTPTA